MADDADRFAKLERSLEGIELTLREHSAILRDQTKYLMAVDEHLTTLQDALLSQLRLMTESLIRTFTTQDERYGALARRVERLETRFTEHTR